MPNAVSARAGTRATVACICLIAAGAALAGCGSYTGGQGAASATAAVDPAATSCRSVQMPQSNMMRRLCQTGAEWEAYDRGQRAASGEFFRGVQGAPVSGGPSNAPVSMTP